MAEPLRLYMGFPGTSPMREFLSFLKTVEACGFDGAGLLDSQMICRDTFLSLVWWLSRPLACSCSRRRRTRSLVTLQCLHDRES
jgi:hypothetical protein